MGEATGFLGAAAVASTESLSETEFFVVVHASVRSDSVSMAEMCVNCWDVSCLDSEV